MQTITVRKSDILETLEENRAAHRAIFEEAVEGFASVAVAQLERHIARIKAGQRYAVFINLDEPVDHTKDYDRAIKMLELSVGETIDLTEADVQQYVMDDWRWKQQFLTSNAGYSVSATRALNS